MGIKKETKEEKVLKKERERVYKEMVMKQEIHRRDEKKAPEDSFVSLQNINKIYPNHVQAVYDFNLEIKQGEFIVFVGPSGCGKSTTLRMIAGLEEITYGDLYINKVFSNDVEPKDRNIAMVFQNYALYPHLNVFDNMAFGLAMRKVNKEEIKKRVYEAAEILDLTEYLNRKPGALSGGQCQRVALGRAIVRHAGLFLMDEPLSNLDAKLRVQMRSEIVRLHNELKATTIYVTHDQTEAMTMADRIVVMSKGYIQQIGAPKEIYSHPANTFVASFIGSPSMNIFNVEYDNGTLVLDDSFKLKLDSERIKQHDEFIKSAIGALRSEIAVFENDLRLGNEIKEKIAKKEKYDKNSDLADPNYISYLELEVAKRRETLGKYENYAKDKKHNVLFGIRPEDILRPEDVTKRVVLSDTFESKVDISELLGTEYYIHFNLGKQKLVAKIIDNNAILMGDNIKLGFNLNNIHLFDDISTKIIF